MASVIDDPGGCKRVLFFTPDKKRRAIRLGKASHRDAETFACMLESLLGSITLRTTPAPKVTAWLNDMDVDLHGKLAKLHLVDPRGSATLQGFLAEYIASRHDVKGSTAAVYGFVQDNLLAHFGTDRSLRSITAGDADGFRLYLIGKELAENTVRRRTGVCKQFFAAAQRRKLIDANPFADQRCAVGGNRERLYFVPRADALKVLEACPTTRWKLIFALSRWGGMRCPSEHLELKWEHIDWATGRILVTSPKTAHHDGKGTRTIPLFPELEPLLTAAFVEQSEPGHKPSEYVIDRDARDARVNWRTTMEKIVRRAGLEPWGKLFANLRATRATELCETFPSHVAAAWLGHSVAIARKHYLSVTPEHFTQATTEAAQKAAQQMPLEACEAMQAPTSGDGQPGVSHELCNTSQGSAGDGQYLQSISTGPLGLEPRTS